VSETKKEEVLLFTDPLVVIGVENTPDGKMLTQIKANGSLTPAGMALILVDILRHSAKMFNVDESVIWDWVEREHLHPTTKIQEVVPQ